MQKVRIVTKDRTYRVIVDHAWKRVSAIFVEDGSSTIDQNDWANVFQALMGRDSEATITRIRETI